MAFPILAAIPVIGTVLEKIFGVIDKAVPDKDLAEKLKQEAALSAMTMEHSEIERLIDARAKIISAEAAAGGPAAAWRPRLMYLFMAILGNNFIFAPYINKFINLTLYLMDKTLPENLQTVPMLEMPIEGWILLISGTSGYVLGRSGEKIFEKLMEARLQTPWRK